MKISNPRALGRESAPKAMAASVAAGTAVNAEERFLQAHAKMIEFSIDFLPPTA